MIKIGLAEDNVFLGKNMSDVLSNTPNYTFKFWAKNGQEVIDQLQEDSNLDVILMDIQMPILNGIEATREINSRYPHIKVLVSTVFDDDDNLFQAILAGASGYLLKDESVEVLYKSIDEMLDGGAPMSPTIAMRALKLLRNPPKETSEVQDFELTKRETEILEHLCHGLSYNQIADNLIISPKTVRKHIENIYQKLNVHSKMDALKVAQKNRLF